MISLVSIMLTFLPSFLLSLSLILGYLMGFIPSLSNSSTQTSPLLPSHTGPGSEIPAPCHTEALVNRVGFCPPVVWSSCPTCILRMPAVETLMSKGSASSDSDVQVVYTFWMIFLLGYMVATPISSCSATPALAFLFSPGEMSPQTCTQKAML